MNKKGIVLLVMLLSAGSLIFASGNKDKEDDSDYYGRGYGPRGMMGYADRDDFPCFDEDLETVTLTGTVDFTATGTVLNADGKEWLLMYPMWALQDVELNRGDTVTVEGLVIEDPVNPARETESGNYLHVVKAEIGGETYELDYAGGWGGGPRGMMGGRRGGGPGYGYRR